MNENRAICWDLDETLGSFRQVAYEMKNEEVPDFEKPLGIRFGARQLLEDLSELGYYHFITTSGSLEYAKEAIKRTGLSLHFKAIFGRETTSPAHLSSGFGKFYNSVAEVMNYSKDEAIQKIVVIGDAPSDQPKDIDGLVFIYHHGMHHYDSQITRSILDLLQEKGQGNFARGFQYLYETAAETSNEKGYKRKEIILHNGFSLYPRYEKTTIFEGVFRRGDYGYGYSFWDYTNQFEGIIPILSVVGKKEDLIKELEIIK